LDTKLHIHCTGTGPALLLIHGWSLHGRVFDTLVKRLAKCCRVYVVDLPGHGLSRDSQTALQLPALVSAIAQATPPAIWCGWSLGGLLALHAAHSLPQVRGLIMLAATPCFVRREQWPDAMDPVVFEQFCRGLAANTQRTVERFLALNVKGSDTAHTSLRSLHHILGQYEIPALNCLDQGLNLLQNSDLRAILPKLEIPGLWIGGQHDSLIPASTLHQAAALVERAKTQVHVVAGSAHVPFIDQPDTVADLMCNFVHASTV